MNEPVDYAIQVRDTRRLLAAAGVKYSPGIMFDLAALQALLKAHIQGPPPAVQPELPHMPRIDGGRRRLNVTDPSYTTFLHIGRRVAKHMPKFHTLREISKQLGVPYRKVETESLVALGRLIWLTKHYVEAS